MGIRLPLRRWYLGLHGLALLRGWPFGDPSEAELRLEAMRQLLAATDDEMEERIIDVLDLESAYRQWAATYDEPNGLILAEERAFARVLEGLPRGRAVDVATGTGRIARRLVGLGHGVVAVDASDAMLRRAGQNAIDVPFVRADLLRLPFRAASFDIVTCALALTHVTDLRAAFSGSARLLEPGGVLVTSDIHPVAVATGGHAFFRREDGSRGVARNEVHWAGAYVEAAVSAGLTVERCIDVLIDEPILQELSLHRDRAGRLGDPDDPVDPVRAVLGLPFAWVWVFRAPA